MDDPGWTYMSGSWQFRARGWPSRDNIEKLLDHFLHVCPPGAKITQWNLNSYGAEEFMITASWACDEPVPQP